MDIDGKWSGYYTYSEVASPFGESTPVDEQFRIEASFRCVGKALSGTMRDVRNLQITPYREIVEAEKHSMSADELARAEAVLVANPELSLRSYLPPNSSLIGTCNEREVKFLKTYIGSTKTSWLYDDGYEDVLTAGPHEVWYEGVLSADEMTIEGRWYIRESFLGKIRPPIATGCFRLERSY